MEDVIQTCPKCQSSNASIRDLKFKVSYCGHSICVKCFDLMFQRTEDFCPKCNLKLTKSNFRTRMFENDSVESYMCHYQEVKRIYNCDQSDFETLEEYNDYLEKVEILIHDLMDSDSCEEARLKMRDHYAVNKADIKLRRNRKDKDIEIYEEWEEKEKMMRLQVNDEMRQEKLKKEYIDEHFKRKLITSNEPLEEVVREYTRACEQESKQLLQARGDNNNVRIRGETVKMYRYVTPSFMRRREEAFQPNNRDLRSEVLIRTLRKPTEGLIRGGGYTPAFWMFRLRYFCD